MKHFTFVFVLFVLISAIFSGCDRGKVPGLVKIEGIITRGGEPLGDAMINFQPTSGGRSAYAKSDESGKFVATTIDPGDGLVKGQYKVLVQKYVIVGYLKGENAGEPIAENSLPKKYSSDDTPLTLDVTAKKLDVKLELVD